MMNQIEASRDHTTNIYDDLPDQDTLGGRLARAREAAGMSTAQLARRLGVKTSTLHLLMLAPFLWRPEAKGAG